MFIGPVVEERPVGFHKSLPAEDAAQRHEEGGRFVVAGYEVGLAGVMKVGPAHHLAFLFATGGSEVDGPVGVVVVAAREEVEPGLIFEEGRCAFVHPAIASLVGADDHGDPHVAQLVRGDIVEGAVAACGIVADERHHRELHTAADDAAALNRRHVGPGIRDAGEGRVIGNGVLLVARGLFPSRGCRAVERIDGRVVGLAVTVAVAHRGTGGFPDGLAHDAEGRVSYARGRETPAQAAILALSGSRLEVVRPDDLPRRVALVGLSHPLDDVGGEHLVGIGERAGGRHEPAFGHLDGHVVVGKTVIELGPADEGVAKPAADVVVEGHLRIPVGEEEEVILAVAHALARAGLRNGKGPRHLDLGGGAGRQGLVRLHQEQRLLDDVARRPARLVFQHLAVDRHPVQADAAGDLGRFVTDGSLGVHVLRQFQAEGAERIGRMVGVANASEAFEAFGFGEEARFQRVPGLLLPVVRSGASVLGASAPCYSPRKGTRRHDRVGERTTRDADRRGGRTHARGVAGGPGRRFGAQGSSGGGTPC